MNHASVPKRHGLPGERTGTAGAEASGLAAASSVGENLSEEVAAGSTPVAGTKRCTCCRTPITVPTCRNVRPWVLPFLYALMFECPLCMSTQAVVLWELPDEMLAEVPAVEAAA